MMQLLPFQRDCPSQRRSEASDSIETMDYHWRWYIEHIAEKRKWCAVQQLYSWLCIRVANALDCCGCLPSIKEVISNRDPTYGTISQQELARIPLCKTVAGVMDSVRITERWVDVSYLQEFYHRHTDRKGMVELYMYWYKQLVQYMCCRVLLRKAPDDLLLQELLQGAETNLKSNTVLAVILDMDYKRFTVKELKDVQKCLEESLNLTPGRLTYICSKCSCVAIYWVIDKRYIARIMLNVRGIFWRLLEHRVTSLELFGSLTLSLKGRHVPYLI